MKPPADGQIIDVELILSPGAKDERRYRATSTDGKTFTLSAPLISPGKGLDDLKLTVDGGNYKVVGHTPDKKVRVGQVDLTLSQINRIQGGPDPQVSLNDNRILHGSVSGLPSVDVEIAGTHSTIPLNDFESIVIERPNLPESVTYKIHARQGGRDLGDLEGSISLAATNTSAVSPAVAASPGTGTIPGSTPGYELIVSCTDSE